jgi:hypothetical protein
MVVKGGSVVTPEEIRDLLIRMADSFERMETENAALKTVLAYAWPRPDEPPLQTQVDNLLQDVANNPIHLRYEQLREELRQAAEEHRLQEILARFPPGGRPN